MDRNTLLGCAIGTICASLSARRAWIEISSDGTVEVLSGVALRKESVDRNLGVDRSTYVKYVALRKESVDRNIMKVLYFYLGTCRSPQGERG